VNVSINKPSKRPKSLSYEKCEDFIINKLSKIKEKQNLKDWCKENNITYPTLSNFYNRKFKKAPHFMASILQALGYEVSFHKEVIFKIEKK